MTVKELLEIIGIIIGVGGALTSGVFTFATYKYTLELKDLHRQIKEDAFNKTQEILDTVTQYAATSRKLQQNNDNLLGHLGTLQCDVRDIKAVLEDKGIIHRRSGYPEEFIPERTDWDIKDV